ncbi:YfhD family protein [Paenibacillus oenotherae]|uniref:YfhD family protein n=1 Tax=Paenibacillus oenotherae TaxID=1435645 RepID=A0ABS7D1C0_9BACL|nr:YfhD family protein [Paenibacillus oenotherae]MBW7473734.1 YfhD family protein [Paenibacillus oenotherae]
MTEQNLEKQNLQNQNFANLPAGQNEDVEFSEALADADDQQAQKRAAQADQNQQEQE